jgi:hypothetical protein
MFIPDPGSDFFHPGSWILIKEFKYFNPKKLFLSSWKYDPDCSSRIPDPDLIPDPGVKKAPDPGSGYSTLNCFPVPDSLIFVSQSTYINTVCRDPQCTVCPIVGIGTPYPLFRKRVCPPPLATRLRVRGGGVPIPTTGEQVYPSIYSFAPRMKTFVNICFEPMCRTRIYICLPPLDPESVAINFTNILNSLRLLSKFSTMLLFSPGIF